MEQASDITVSILPRPDIEQVHRQTVNRIGQILVTFADEVRVWCDQHPDAVEEAARWLAEREKTRAAK